MKSVLFLLSSIVAHFLLVLWLILLLAGGLDARFDIIEENQQQIITLLKGD